MADIRPAIETRLPLEDTFVDILGKAQRGLKLSDADLCERADVDMEILQTLRNGHIYPAALAKLAVVLNLHPQSLIDSSEGHWYPQPVEDFDGLAMFTTPYGDMTVNAFLVWDRDTREAASFDTGATCQPMLDCIREKGLTLKRIFITHTHPDHLADLARLQASSGKAPSYGSAVENPLGLKPLSHGDGLMLGNVKIRVRGTSGHTPGGLSYVIEEHETPMVIVGDALFAGSMGGAPNAYQDALLNNRTRILSLPNETIICPGHGPLTTVGEERRHNPFFPEFKPKALL